MTSSIAMSGLKLPIHILPLFSVCQSHQAADATAPRPARPRFLFVGRLTASKGIVQLLQEFAALSAFDLHVIGDGELRGELQHEGGALRSLSRLAYEPGLREALARRAREGLLRLYTPQHHLKGYLALVESIRLAKGVH